MIHVPAADLVPEARSLAWLEGALDLSGGARVLAVDPRLQAAARLAAAWIDEALALRGVRSAGGTTEASAALRLELVAGLGPEDYRLEILGSGALLQASAPDGAIRGASTLRQLLLSEGPILPALRIEDGPRFGWRGAMLDCARNFFRVEFVERFLDLMALHKLNRFHWHLTDDQAWRLEIRSRPELTGLGSRRRDDRHAYPRYIEGSYTREDARRVVDYAADRGIVVVPEIETPGHALALLASHPELSCAGAAAGGGPFSPEGRYGIFEDILCAGNEATFELLGEVFDELASIFPGPWVHAGGDEAPKVRWLACPRCRDRMEREGLRGPDGTLDPELLQGYFMNRVAGMLADRGKRMIGWDEVLEGARQGGLAPGAVIMSWRGEAGGAEAARLGREAVMCPQGRACYLDHKHLELDEEPGNLGVCTVEDSYSYEPIPKGLSEAEGALILGGQANLWSEYLYFGRQVEYMAFPRLCALAEAFWSPREKRDFPSFARRMGAHGARLDLLGVNRYRGALRA